MSAFFQIIYFVRRKSILAATLAFVTLCSCGEQTLVPFRNEPTDEDLQDNDEALDPDATTRSGTALVNVDGGNLIPSGQLAILRVERFETSAVATFIPKQSGSGTEGVFVFADLSVETLDDQIMVELFLRDEIDNATLISPCCENLDERIFVGNIVATDRLQGNEPRRYRTNLESTRPDAPMVLPQACTDSRPLCPVPTGR